MPKPPKTELGEVVSDYVSRFPNVGKRTLARELFNANLFPSLEAARNAVRYYLGTQGDLRRKQRGIDKADAPLGEAGKPVGSLPPGIRQTLAPMRFDGKRRWFAYSDPHIPYHDEQCLLAFIDLAVSEGCDGVLCNGDYFDFHQISRFQRNPHFRSVADEIRTGQLVADYIDERFPAAFKVIKLGNHCIRYRNMIWNQAPQLIGVPEVELINIMRFPERGWVVVDDKQRFSIGKLNGYHGHELSSGMSQPKNLAESLWSKTRMDGFAGHNHRPTWFVDHGGVTRQQTRTFTLGCCCHLEVDHAIVNGWQQTCAIIDVDDEGNWTADQYGHKDGKVFRIV